MAKPRDIEGLDGSRRSLAWVSKIVLTRFDEMAEYRHAATGFAEIKGVHDMRVAARRVRSVIRDIEPFLPKNTLKESKKELKTISDTLGAVRDCDVAISLLDKFSGETNDEAIKAGIAFLAEENAERRNAARTDLTAVIPQDAVDKLRKKLESAIKEGVRESEKLSFDEAAGRMVERNLADLLDLGPKIYKPFKRSGLHRLRIVSKRLRYSLELARISRGDEAKKLAKEISRLQDFLGELHDCDLWTDNLSARLRANDNDEVRAAAAWLMPQFVRKQNKEYLSAFELWEEWREDDFARRIERVISLGRN